MGWFAQQILQRKQSDDDVFSDSFAGIARAVMGESGSAPIGDENVRAQNAIEQILRFFHVKPREIPDGLRDRNERLEYLMRPYGIMRRTVNLEPGWYKDAIGPMLGTRKDTGDIIALIPNGFSGYTYFDEITGKRMAVNRKTRANIETEAVCFYKPLPLTKIGIPALMRYIAQTISASDIVAFALSALAVTLVGLLGPRLNHLLFSEVIESGSLQPLLAVSAFLVCASVSALALGAIKSLLLARIQTKMNISVEAAAMARVLSLPASFFKEFSSGELSTRTRYIGSLCEMLVSSLLSAGLTSVFSLVYISQVFSYAPALVVPSLLIVLVNVLFSAASVLMERKISRERMERNAKKSGFSYAVISGVQKIKLAGAEKRAFAKWGGLFAKEAELTYNPPLFLKINSVISTAISLSGALLLYFAAIKSGVSVADYYAFTAAYGMVSGAFLSLSGIALTVAQIQPVAEMARPILNATPEVSDGKLVLTRLSGSIEINNVSFRYNESMPLILNDLSLKIRPGQYVALVGATGCGKSTLMRLLLGFETPQKGAVYYDGKDLSAIDLRSLRRNIGVVMQNGKLFQGDVFSNITISAPWLTMDEAWEAAELAGIAEDIRQMPMGMRTLISEGSGGISGGQRQRLMIARAIAPKPKILMFDEATSALDNVTQRQVSDSLDALKCTRIVIAHRLSTIRHCDRILVLENGRVIEDGGYEELLGRKGVFAELVERQRLNAAP